MQVIYCRLSSLLVIVSFYCVIVCASIEELALTIPCGAVTRT
jgi:hypothetical protein